MNDFISELIGFSIVTLVVIMLAFLTKKMEAKYHKEDKEDK